MKTDDFVSIVNDVSRNLGDEFGGGDNSLHNKLVKKISKCARRLDQKSVEELFVSDRIDVKYWIAGCLMELEDFSDISEKTMNEVAQSSSNTYSNMAQMVLAVRSSKAD